jgi:hypothetical protein
MSSTSNEEPRVNLVSATDTVSQVGDSFGGPVTTEESLTPADAEDDEEPRAIITPYPPDPPVITGDQITQSVFQRGHSRGRGA